ncbi:MAG: hypothetical protein J4F28_01685 [Nitrosopumilaceae archaeon]|nr:hypothetical protein [Nitrosopumilaceae archaeon]
MYAEREQDTGRGDGQGESGVTTAKASGDEANFDMCSSCGETLDVCVCVCKFCKERDGCECALFDAATGG